MKPKRKYDSIRERKSGVRGAYRLYVGRAYDEQLIDTKARYRTTLVKIPTSEFYVFYNGKKK